MLDRIVNILNSSNCTIDDGTLFCNNHIITDSDCIDYLNANNIIENTLTSTKVGDTINLELSLAVLNSIGYYESITVFVLKNKCSISQGNYYIEELKCYNTNNNEFVNKYLGVIRLIDSVKKIARYNHTDVDTDNSLIFREDKALLLPFIYEDTDITQINNDDVEKLISISLTFESNDSDNKKLLYINELIDFLSSENENDRFKFLLSHIAEFADRANNAYQYYIRNFSYNKLKTELDNAALDYSKKIQSVINDAQTKLIAIPAAFLFAAATMDFDKVLSYTNIGVIVCSFIFAIFIDLFIKNQKSALKFITHNIEQYKNSFSNQNKLVADSFSIVDTEIKKQKKRLNIVHCITWGLPITLFIITLIIYLCTTIQTQN